MASVRCARTLRREGFAGSMLIVGSEPDAPYNRPPLSKELIREDLPDELVAAEPASWYERRRIALLLGATVVALDPEARIGTLDDGTRVRFGWCLLATGAEAVGLPVAGAAHGLPLRTLADARRLRAAAAVAGRGARAVVVGGGFIGVEVASGLAALGLRPVVVERADALWGGSLGPSLSEWGVERLAAAGVEVRLRAAVSRLAPNEVRVGEEVVGAAMTVIGVGVRPRTELAVAAGLQVDDGIVTDAAQRTSHPAIWAAGDVARSAANRFEHWHAARESGERAARSMLGLDSGPIPVPWLFSEVGGVPLDVVGSATAEDEALWLGGRSALVWVAAGRVVQAAIVDGAVAPDEARRLIGEGSSVGLFERSIATARA